MLIAKLSPSSSDNVVDVLNRRSEQISSTAVTMRSDAEYFAIYSKKIAVWDIRKKHLYRDELSDTHRCLNAVRVFWAFVQRIGEQRCRLANELRVDDDRLTHFRVEQVLLALFNEWNEPLDTTRELLRRFSERLETKQEGRFQCGLHTSKALTTTSSSVEEVKSWRSDELTSQPACKMLRSSTSSAATSNWKRVTNEAMFQFPLIHSSSSFSHLQSCLHQFFRMSKH